MAGGFDALWQQLRELESALEKQERRNVQLRVALQDVAEWMDEVDDEFKNVGHDRVRDDVRDTLGNVILTVVGNRELFRDPEIPTFEEVMSEPDDD